MMPDTPACGFVQNSHDAYHDWRIKTLDKRAGVIASIAREPEGCTVSGPLIRVIYERAGLPTGLFGVLLATHKQSDKIIEHKLVRPVTIIGSDKARRSDAQ